MTKELFMQRIRKALKHEASTVAPEPPALLKPLAQWSQAEVIERFVLELHALAGHVHVLANEHETIEKTLDIVKSLGASSYIASAEATIAPLVKALSIPKAQDAALADVGITGASYGIANTGSIVITSDADRHASLMPMNHIALLHSSKIFPTMAEAYDYALAERQQRMPSAWVQATGPSRTADIELTLTTGVHGPGVVHLLLIQDA